MLLKITIVRVDENIMMVELFDHLMLLVLEKSQRQQLLQELGVAWLDIPL
jgi:hypothetical protein